MEDLVILTEKQANLRRASISSAQVHYNLVLIYHSRLLRTETDFSGVVQATFTLNQTDNVFFDCQVIPTKVLVNSKNSEIKHVQGKLHIDPLELVKGEANTVTVHFNGTYSNICNGLNYHCSSSDNSEYIYTQFELFGCNRTFPCFDQPNIKATLRLTTIHPSKWVSLGNSSEIFRKELTSATLRESDVIKSVKWSETDLSHLENYSITAFKKTYCISSYLFAMAAGNFHCISSTSEYKLPMRVYRIQSDKNQGNPEDFFSQAEKCVDFYEEFFSCPFPFDKVDHIFCPDFKFGAMENVGLIVYSNGGVAPDTDAAYVSHLTTLFHELAHMWFGNLVTMEWWDDLWLNEAFATFISYFTLSRVNPSLDEGAKLNAFQRKAGGMFEDMRQSTHSVYSEVPDTETGESNFDAIVYNKGMSVLKQFFYILGEECFRKALKAYFEDFKWGNTKFEDLVSKFIQVYEGELDLKSVTTNWLTKAGLMKLKCDFTEKEGRIDNFNIIQSAYQANFNNPQTFVLDLQLIYADRVETVKRLTVQGDKTEIASLKGKEYPEAVVLNYNDWAFCYWDIDERSYSYLEANLHRIDCSVARAYFLETMFYDTRSAKISSPRYIDALAKTVQSESNVDVLTEALNNALPIIERYIPAELRESNYKKMSDSISKLILKHSDDETVVRGLMLSYIRFLVTEEDAKIVKEMLEEGALFYSEGKKIKLDCVLGPRLERILLLELFMFNSVSLEEKRSLLEKTLGEDPSTAANKTRIITEYSLPGKEAKQKIVDLILENPRKYPENTMKSIMNSFYNIKHREEAAEFCCNTFFSVAPKVGKSMPESFLSSFVYGMGPGKYISEENVGKMKILIEKTKAETPAMARLLTALTDNMEKALACHNLALNKN